MLTGYSNLAFSIGGTVAVPDTGFGIAGGAMLDDHWYVKAGVHDANGDASDPSLQVIANPALDPGQNTLVVGSLRARLVF